MLSDGRDINMSIVMSMGYGLEVVEEGGQGDMEGLTPTGLPRID